MVLADTPRTVARSGPARAATRDIVPARFAPRPCTLTPRARALARRQCKCTSPPTWVRASGDAAGDTRSLARSRRTHRAVRFWSRHPPQGLSLQPRDLKRAVAFRARVEPQRLNGH